MQMSFEFSDEIENFIFKTWTAHNTAAFAGVCIFSAILAILTEFLSFVKVYMLKKANVNPLVFGLVEGDAQNHPELVRPLLIPPSMTDFRNRKIRFHIAQSFLHIIHLVSGYFLMLAIMTYNGWVAIAIVVGAAIGYFIFGAVRDTLAFKTDASFGNSGEFSSQEAIQSSPATPPNEETHSPEQNYRI